MNPKDLAETTKNSPTVAFHKFVLLTRGREHDLFCFFEGNDSVYYSSRIKTYVEREYHPISCGNKKSVLGTYELLRMNDAYKRYRKAFFVDSDFDRPINNPEIYETPCYSVENLYVNTNTLREILKNEFQLTEAEPSFKAAIDLFEEQLGGFNEATLGFNAWYACLKGKHAEAPLNISLDDKIPNKFICIKIGAIRCECTLADIMLHYPHALVVNDDEVNAVADKLRAKGLTKSLRGKFQLWFFYEFLQYLVADSHGDQKVIKSKTKFNLNKGQMISQLSQYAETPEPLITYLLKFN